MHGLSPWYVPMLFLTIANVGGLGCANAFELSELASVSGRVRYEGATPRNPDQDDLGQRRPLFRVDGESKGLADAIVYLRRLDGLSSTLPERVVSGEPVLVVQRDFRFEPHLIVVAPGQEVVFANDDGENHNVRGEGRSGGNGFNVVTTPEQSYARSFEAEADYGPIRIGCDVHAWMRGWVYVIPHGLFAVTDRLGEFRIEGVPVGRYSVRIEQPDGGLVARGEIELVEKADAVVDAIFGREHLGGQTEALALFVNRVDGD